MASAFLFASGRLGNQIFQYSALRDYFPGDTNFNLVGFGSLFNTFANVEARQVRLPRRLRVRLQTFLEGVTAGESSRLGVNIVSEDKRTGLVHSALSHAQVSYCSAAYFQSQATLDGPTATGLRFRPEIVQAGTDALNDFGLAGAEYCTVHVRRGDYANWPSARTPAMVEDHWLFSAAEEVRGTRPGVRFLVLGDDPESNDFIARELGGITSRSREEVDLFLMSRATAGVLSPSSFAWCGSDFARRQSVTNGPFIAPLYWAGHARDSWYPPSSKTDWLTYRLHSRSERE